MRERSVTRCRKSQLLGFGLPLRRGKVQIGLIFKSRIQDVACGCLLVAGALLPPVPPGNQLQQLAAILDLSSTFPRPFLVYTATLKQVFGIHMLVLESWNWDIVAKT